MFSDEVAVANVLCFVLLDSPKRDVNCSELLENMLFKDVTESELEYLFRLEDKRASALSVLCELSSIGELGVIKFVLELVACVVTIKLDKLTLEACFVYKWSPSVALFGSSTLFSSSTKRTDSPSGTFLVTSFSDAKRFENKIDGFCSLTLFRSRLALSNVMKPVVEDLFKIGFDVVCLDSEVLENGFDCVECANSFKNNPDKSDRGVK